MYAVGFIGWYNPMGNDGLQRLHYKSKKGIMRETQTMRKINTTVYVVNDFTQKMCEMDSIQLAEYCSNHYIYKLPCGKEE